MPYLGVCRSFDRSFLKIDKNNHKVTNRYTIGPSIHPYSYQVASETLSNPNTIASLQGRNKGELVSAPPLFTRPPFFLLFLPFSLSEFLGLFVCCCRFLGCSSFGYIYHFPTAVAVTTVAKEAAMDVSSVMPTTWGREEIMWPMCDNKTLK